MYKLLLTARFERKLKKISKMSKKEAEKIKSIITKLSNNPFDPILGTHKLAGKLDAFYSCSCGYDCRIIFSFEKIDEQNSLIYLIDIGSHDDVY